MAGYCSDDPPRSANVPMRRKIPNRIKVRGVPLSRIVAEQLSLPVPVPMGAVEAVEEADSKLF